MAVEEIVIPANNADDSQFERLLELCGEPIGIGTSRNVYSIPGHCGKVLKVCKVASNASNWAEVIIYHSVNEQAYFGEIFSFSLSGKYLIMEYLADLMEPLSGIEVPNWWQDKKRSNLGRSLTGEIKIRDYALLAIDSGYLFRFS